MRIRSTLAMLAAALLPAATLATAAVGSIEFQKVDVSFSGKDGRPEAPVIVASNKDADGKWRASDDPVRFKVRVHVKLNSRSDVTRIVLGVPAIGAPQSTWPVFSMEPHLSAREAIVDPITRHVPSNALAIPSLTAANMCAAAGRSGTFKLPFSLDIQVEVSAKRGVKHDESRRRIFDRKLPAEIKCIAVSHAVTEPQRTTGAPKRTPGEPKRTLSPYRPLTAELGFARAANATACPIDIRQTIRIVSPGPGTAKVYIVRQDNPGILGAPIYVEVDTRLSDAKYAGVLRKTIRFAKPFNRAFRVLAVNPFGEPVASPWAVLDVKC